MTVAHPGEILGNTGIADTDAYSVKVEDILGGLAASDKIGYTPRDSAVGLGSDDLTIGKKLRHYVDLTDFANSGVDPFSSEDPKTNLPVDWTDAFERAIGTGLHVRVPQGTFKITRPLYLKVGQCLIGEGVTNTAISLAIADFQNTPLNAEGHPTLGIINMVDTSTGADLYRSGIRGIGFLFEQTGQTRSTLHTYPWAIYANVGRVEVPDILITGASHGMYFGVGAGAPIGGTWEIGATSCGLVMENSADTVIIHTIRFWPYGINGDVYLDGNTVGAIFHELDGLTVDTLFTLGAKIIFEKGTYIREQGYVPRGPFGTIGAFQIDTAFNSVDFKNGTIQVASGYIAINATTKYALKMEATSADHLRFDNCWILCPGGDTATGAGLVQTTTGNQGTLSIAGGNVQYAFHANAPVFRHQSGTMILNNIVVEDDGDTNQNVRSVGFIECSGGQVIVQDFRLPTKGNKSGPGVRVSNTADHLVDIGHTGGWDIYLPGTHPSTSPGNLNIGYYNIHKAFSMTPTFGGGTSSYTYNKQDGQYYLKDGRVEFQLDLEFNVVGGGNFGPAVIFPNIPATPQKTQSATISFIQGATIPSGLTIGAEVSGSFFYPTFITTGAGSSQISYTFNTDNAPPGATIRTVGHGSYVPGNP